jgi:hypothetical protein
MTCQLCDLASSWTISTVPLKSRYGLKKSISNILPSSNSNSFLFDSSRKYFFLAAASVGICAFFLTSSPSPSPSAPSVMTSSPTLFGSGNFLFFPPTRMMFQLLSPGPYRYGSSAYGSPSRPGSMAHLTILKAVLNPGGSLSRTG